MPAHLNDSASYNPNISHHQPVVKKSPKNIVDAKYIDVFKHGTQWLMNEIAESQKYIVEADKRMNRKIHWA